MESDRTPFWNAVKDRHRVLHHLSAEPAAHDDDRKDYSKKLDCERESLFLDLSGRLKNSDHKAEDHADKDRGT